MKNILVVEDNTAIRENLEAILELQGYNVISAANGKIGIEKAFHNKPDLILSDIQMPLSDGYQVYKSLKKFLQDNEIPFVFLTSSAQEKEIIKGKELGASAYLTKPFHSKELLNTLDNLLR